MTHCRMCSQRLTRAGRLCRECERELARARMAGLPADQPGSPVGVDPAHMAVTNEVAGTSRTRARAATIVAALAIGAAVAATLPAVERPGAIGAPRSVMLERDLSHVTPRTFAPAGARATAREEHAAAARASAPTPSTRRIVRISSVASDPVATEEVAPLAPARVAAAPAVAHAPRYDRVLAFSDALARCGEESFFARLVCEERARRRYCEGASDLPQCASAPPRDYGN